MKNICLITGATGGIGSEIALQLANKYDIIGICYNKNIEKAQEVRATIMEKGGEAIALQGDVTQKAHVKSMIEKAKQYGKIHTLITATNVGHPTFKSSSEQDTEKIIQRISNEIKSFAYAAHFAAEFMKEYKEGIILYISSIDALSDAGPVDQSLAKNVTDKFIRCLSSDYAKFGISLNSVRPGAILTPASEQILSGRIKTHVEDRTMKNTIMSSEDFAKAVEGVLFLSARGLVGQNIALDDGFLSLDASFTVTNNRGE